MANQAAMVATDVLIIGGGPAGLSAALGLARHLYHAIVFDNNKFRNYAAQHMHNVLTWDHKPPAEFRAAARADLAARYETIQFKANTVVKLRQVEDGFEAVDDDGTLYTGKKVVLAYGRNDIFPDIKGYSQCWGRSVFHCLFCHGYEERGESAGILAQGMLTNPNMLLHVARMAAQLAREITIYTHGNSEVTPSVRESLKDKPLRIDDRKIAALEDLDGKGVRVHFEDNQSTLQAFVTHMPSTKLSGDLHIQLGLDMEDQFGQPCVKTSGPFKETSVAGCFVAGDITTAMASVVNAMQSGGLCAAALSPQLAQIKSF